METILWISWAIGLLDGIAITVFYSILKYIFNASKNERKLSATPEVIDAQFVVTHKPQLNSSQALVTRTSLERRQP